MADAPHDPVNHPSHYTDGAIEHITYVASRPGWIKGYTIGNCTKYLHRAGLKDGSSELQDLRKAAWFLDYYIKWLEKQPQP